MKTRTAMTFGASMRPKFLLEDGIAFLNHGSYGATPRVVLAAQDEWRARMERQPVGFMNRVLPGALREAAGVLALVAGHQAPGHRDHPPPGVLIAVIVQETPHRPRRPGPPGLRRHGQQPDRHQDRPQQTGEMPPVKIR